MNAGGLAPHGPRAAPGIVARAIGVVLLVHPFPSALDAVATAALALLAGSSPAVAAQLGGAMLALQLAIGVVNDLADAPHDALSRPSKPIPAGLVGPGAAAALAGASAALGLGLSAPFGVLTFAVAVLGLAIGLLYDVALKASRWSWVPFAVGIPLVPIFAWLGATGSVSPAVLGLAALAVPAGAGLAIANALVDVPGDRAAEIVTAAAALGSERAWVVATTLLGGTYAVATVLLLVAGAGLHAGSGGGELARDMPAISSAGSWVAIAAAGVILAAGAWLDRGLTQARRRLGWQLEGVAVALLGVAWIGAFAAAGQV